MTQLLVDHVLGLLKGVANVDGVIWLASWEKIEDDPYAQRCVLVWKTAMYPQNSVYDSFSGSQTQSSHCH